MTELKRSDSASSSASRAGTPPSPALSAEIQSRALRHVATEPALPTQLGSSSSTLHQGDPSGPNLAHDGPSSPPLASPYDEQAFTSLHPQGYSRHKKQSAPTTTASRKNMGSSPSNKAFTSIKNKLKTPSTTQKSKSEIVYSLSTVDSHLESDRVGPSKSGLAAKSGSGGMANALMQRGPPPNNPLAEKGHDSRKSTDIKQLIQEQEQRLQDLDQAQTEGLLRSQQEAGVDPAGNPSDGPKSPKLIGLPLFKKSKEQKESSTIKETHDPQKQKSGTWTSKLLTKIPIKEFPLQGAGRESEFNQECPLWARQPYKYAYFAWFGLSVGLVYLPYWSVTSLPRSGRGREDWSWKKATMVKLYRHGTQLTFRTRTSLGRDLLKEVPHSKTVRSKFCWVDPVGDDDIRGEIRRAMKVQRIKAMRTCGFWYGEIRKPNRSSTTRDSGSFADDSGVGKPAEPGEKVLYHLHGGAYWIGTAHEKDVTAAVNTESLRYMNEIYKRREQAGTADSSSSTSSSSDSAKGKLLRSFSLDYRLCVPGRPKAGSYPAALLDALSGYIYLVRRLGFAPENIIVAGDSAGGNLGIALCRYLRDEGVEGMPGSLLLMSPWVDISRSHSGPTALPNRESSVYTNQKSDIISPSLAFRNTAVSAFLGNLPARDTYRNPYISPVSLQLPIEHGGSAPDWGFEGFPRQIYICTGSAEISYDHHLTLAHRMAQSTKRGKPVYMGDKLSEHANARHLAERRDIPRQKDMICPKGINLVATPADELAQFSFGRSASAEADMVIDGEPRISKSQGRKSEERVVYLDEVKDAVHDYLLFKWFEPERSCTWRRIANWIDQDQAQIEA